MYYRLYPHYYTIVNEQKVHKLNNDSRIKITFDLYNKTLFKKRIPVGVAYIH